MVRPRYRGLGAGTVALALATLAPGCAPGSPDTNGLDIGAVDSDPHAVTGEFVTYIADKRDGTTEWWHAVRTSDGREVRLDFDTPSLTATGTQVRVHGDMVGARMHVATMEELPAAQIAAEGEPAPPTYALTSPDSYALVLVDLGMGVDLTTGAAYGAPLPGQRDADRQIVRRVLQRGLLREIPGDRHGHRPLPILDDHL